MMRIDELLKHVQMKGVEISPKQESVLMDTFGACPRIECMIKSSKTLIVQSTSLEEQCFILHEDGNMNKANPKDDEVFFGVLISTMGETSYIIALPVS